MSNTLKVPLMIFAPPPRSSSASEGGRLLSELLRAVSITGKLFGRRSNELTGKRDAADQLKRSVRALQSEAAGAACVHLAEGLVEHLAVADTSTRELLLTTIATSAAVDARQIDSIIEAYRVAPSRRTLAALHYASEPTSIELLRRINLAPGGTLALVKLRETLLDMLSSAQHASMRDELASLDDDFVHVFTLWFNRGFLSLERIDWASPAALLEKIIRYEAVHSIQDWSDLRSRIDPDDKRCFAFFHPALPDEPLIFVEVALMGAVPRSITEILTAERTAIRSSDATTAVFYSISNCQRGLTGVSFGEVLIKQVVDMLRAEFPKILTFVTLSPVPGFTRWLEGVLSAENAIPKHAALSSLLRAGGPWDASVPVDVSESLQLLAAQYLVVERSASGKPLDAVARFHLGNGATLAQINPFADLSAKGVKQSLGVMVNYHYDLSCINSNQKAYAAGEVVADAQVRRCLS